MCARQWTTGPRARVKSSGSAAPVSLFRALEASPPSSNCGLEATAAPSKKAMSAADKERRKQARDALRQAKQKCMSELARQAGFRANNEMPQAQPATLPVDKQQKGTGIAKLFVARSPRRNCEGPRAFG